MIKIRMLVRHNLIPSEIQLRKPPTNPNLENLQSQVEEKRRLDEQMRASIEAKASKK